MPAMARQNLPATAEFAALKWSRRQPQSLFSRHFSFGTAFARYFVE
jgi:hypothetical protein